MYNICNIYINDYQLKYILVKYHNNQEYNNLKLF